jgi:hypothetical protein
MQVCNQPSRPASPHRYQSVSTVWPRATGSQCAATRPRSPSANSQATPTALCATCERTSGQIDAAHSAIFWTHSSVRPSRSGLRSESATCLDLPESPGIWDARTLGRGGLARESAAVSSSGVLWLTNGLRPVPAARRGCGSREVCSADLECHRGPGRGGGAVGEHDCIVSPVGTRRRVVRVGIRPGSREAIRACTRRSRRSPREAGGRVRYVPRDPTMPQSASLRWDMQ